jgi:hypothetical protein
VETAPQATDSRHRHSGYIFHHCHWFSTLAISFDLLLAIAKIFVEANSFDDDDALLLLLQPKRENRGEENVAEDRQLFSSNQNSSGTPMTSALFPMIFLSLITHTGR